MNNIKQGYMLQLMSWENEYDNCKTITLDGLSPTVAKFYVEFAHLFEKCWHSGGLAANAYDSDDVKWPELVAAVRALFAKYPGVADEMWGSDEFLGDDDDELQDTIRELATEVLGSSDFCFRVFERYRAYYIPEEIVEHKFDFTPFGE